MPSRVGVNGPLAPRLRRKSPFPLTDCVCALSFEGEGRRSGVPLDAAFDRASPRHTTARHLIDQAVTYDVFWGSLGWVFP